MRGGRIVAGVVLGLLLLPSPARAHGAALGLHVHVPDRVYRPGQVIRVRIHAREPIRDVLVGFPGEEPRRLEPRRPTRHLALRMRIPRGLPGSTTGLQAEGHTAAGRVVRAAAVVRLAP